MVALTPALLRTIMIFSYRQPRARRSLKGAAWSILNACNSNEWKKRGVTEGKGLCRADCRDLDEYVRDRTRRPIGGSKASDRAINFATI